LESELSEDTLIILEHFIGLVKTIIYFEPLTRRYAATSLRSPLPLAGEGIDPYLT
jgi:hypothetical protein